MTVEIGTPVTVDGTATDTVIGIQTFDATNGVEIYEDTGTLYARYLAISGSAITTPVARVTVDASFSASFNIDTCRVSATSILVTYRQSGSSVVRLITLSGTTLTVQAATVLTDTALVPTLEPLSTTHILYTYKDVSALSGKARVLTFSGMTVIENASVVFSEASATIYASDNTILTSTKAVVGWVGRVAAANPMAVVVTLSGTTLTVNTRLLIDSPNVGISSHATRSLAVSAFSTTLIMFAYEQAASAGSRGVILTESAATLSAGTLGDAGGTKDLAIRNWDANNAVLAASSLNLLTVRRINRSGTTFSTPDVDTLAITAGGASAQVFLADISATQALIGFENSADAAVITFTFTSKIWKRDSAGAWADISSGAWADPVRAIYVKPGLDDDTIWAATGMDIYRTDNGGTSWTLKATLTFEPEGIDGLPADNSVIAYTKDAAGTNRFAIITDTTVVYRDSGHSTTGKGTIARGVA